MFSGCARLVGGDGTAFDAARIGGELARVDGLDGKPGYFTGVREGGNALPREGDAAGRDAGADAGI